MKISKKDAKVKASEVLEVVEVPEVVEVVEAPDAVVPLEEVEEEVADSEDFTPSRFLEVTDLLEQAIEKLAEPAKCGDQLARESIANLSVILLDLK